MEGKNRSSFIDSIKIVESDEIKLMKLQKQYNNGTIREEDLTEKQVNELCILYDKQIAELKKSIANKEKKILENMIKIKMKP